MSTSFAELREARHRTKTFCTGHRDSIRSFLSGISFKRKISEESLGRGVRHLTSTATSLESLLDCPEFSDTSHLLNRFALRAIRRSNWTSDGSAPIYCRCRALPLVIRHLTDWDSRIVNHLRAVLAQIETLRRFGIGEAEVKRARGTRAAGGEEGYQPNAFHTYWCLKLTETINDKFSSHYHALRVTLNLDECRDKMLIWTEQTLGRHIALQASNSTLYDADQLAWSLVTVMQFRRPVPADLARREIFRLGLKSFFASQDESGIWRRGAPLFHYKKAGNAYCYVFETLATLLRVSLAADDNFLREELKPYLNNLLRALYYAEQTRMPIPGVDNGWGWSSGHRREEFEPESWATASVYLFGQGLRRLLGIWTREAALKGLNEVVLPHSPPRSERDLIERGDTWSSVNPSEVLVSMFVNPCRMAAVVSGSDPDLQVIGDQFARSAILYGPAGTSKTTLVRSLAGTIGWRYVEIHPSHFVADGLPNVQRTADEIFSRLMELDRTVVLFDEIDELVREREDRQVDAFGRFLTTSMLPRIAELWRGRRVLYFVATNHVRYFDAAAIRAQRFDALVLVAPPSFAKKRRFLEDRIKQLSGDRARVFWKLRKSEIDGALERIRKGGVHLEGDEDAKSRSERLSDAEVLSKFILLRWDRLDELAVRLREACRGRDVLVNAQTMSAALRKVADLRLESREPYLDYLEDKQREQRDFGRLSAWQVVGTMPAPLRKAASVREVGGQTWLIGNWTSVDEISAEGYRFRSLQHGQVRLRRLARP